LPVISRIEDDSFLFLKLFRLTISLVYCILIGIDGSFPTNTLAMVDFLRSGSDSTNAYSLSLAGILGIKALSRL